VRVTDVADTTAARKRLGMPEALRVLPHRNGRRLRARGACSLPSRSSACSLRSRRPSGSPCRACRSARRAWRFGTRRDPFRRAAGRPQRALDGVRALPRVTTGCRALAAEPRVSPRGAKPFDESFLMPD
jgi:hypothetical protein